MCDSLADSRMGATSPAQTVGGKTSESAAWHRMRLAIFCCCAFRAAAMLTAGGFVPVHGHSWPSAVRGVHRQPNLRPGRAGDPDRFPAGGLADGVALAVLLHGRVVPGVDAAVRRLRAHPTEPRSQQQLLCP